jgi:hypothetical protein
LHSRTCSRQAGTTIICTCPCLPLPALAGPCLPLLAPQGMEYLHSKGVVHLNLKTGNLLVGFAEKQPACKVTAHTPDGG